MPLNNKAIIEQIDTVIDQYEGWNSDICDLFDVISIYTLLCSTLEQLAPKNSIYARNVQAVKQNIMFTSTSSLGQLFENENNIRNIAYLAEILKALRFEYEKGYLTKIEDLANANAFNNVLDDAEYLLKKGYKDPAAFMIGCVLESHIKRLCEKSNIPLTYTNKKDDVRKYATHKLNEMLNKKGVYNNATFQHNIGWLNIRNDADHSDWNKYTKENVEEMLRSVRHFIENNP